MADGVSEVVPAVPPPPLPVASSAAAPPAVESTTNSYGPPVTATNAESAPPPASLSAASAPAPAPAPAPTAAPVHTHVAHRDRRSPPKPVRDTDALMAQRQPLFPAETAVQPIVDYIVRTREQTALVAPETVAEHMGLSYVCMHAFCAGRVMG